MEKAYEPQEVETRRYREWDESGVFHAEPTPGKPKYSVTIPPPNVTGSLHMGHALNHAVQDTLGALAPDARLHHSHSAGGGPCGYRDPDGGGERDRQRRPDPLHFGPGSVY